MDISGARCFNSGGSITGGFAGVDVGYYQYTACSQSFVYIPKDVFVQLALAAGCPGPNTNTGVCVGLPASSDADFTADEIQALKIQAANPNPFVMSLEDGALLSAAILGVWVTAWCARALYSVLRTDTPID